jgi:hypothetical protein
MKQFAKFSGTTILAALAAAAHADVLYDNGPIITNPTGGTGSIAGQPISNADSYTIPGNPLVFSTTGVNATYVRDTKVAEDFVVPEPGWDLDAVTLYGMQTSQTTPTVTTIYINLWTEVPYSDNSPPPLPDPLPQPVLVKSLELPAGEGVFVAHRQGPSTTSTVRPIFAYTVSLDGLPNEGRLEPGTYWLEWTYVGAPTPSNQVSIPLVSPRTAVENHNARVYNSIDGSANGPRSWFEGREGYSEGVSEGRAYALPFVLHGTVLSASLLGDMNCDGVVSVSDIGPFVLAVTDPIGYEIAFPDCDILNADINGSGDVTVGDIGGFVALLAS